MTELTGGIFKLKDNFIFVISSDEGLLLDTETKRYYTVNETTATLLRELRKGGISFEHLLDKVLEEYEVTPERAMGDTLGHLTSLLNAGIIEGISQEAPIKPIPPPGKKEYVAYHCEQGGSLSATYIRISKTKLPPPPPVLEYQYRQDMDGETLDLNISNKG